MKYIKLLLITIIFITGCANKQPQLKQSDKLKSCDAMKFEYQDSIKKIKDIKVKQKETSKVHKVVLSSGILISLTPAVLFSPYWYVMPSISIWYYNTFFDNNDRLDYKKKLLQRQKIVKKTLKKRCNAVFN